MSVNYAGMRKTNRHNKGGIMERIICNKIQCVHCKEIIESYSEHDFKMCQCGACGVDGGHDYLKRIGNPEDYVELSIVGEIKTT